MTAHETIVRTVVTPPLDRVEMRQQRGKKGLLGLGFQSACEWGRKRYS